MIVTSSRFQIYILFLATTSFKIHLPKRCGRGQLSAAFMNGIFFPEMAQIQSPLRTICRISFYFSIKDEGMRMPAYYLQNDDCDAIQMSFFEN